MSLNFQEQLSNLAVPRLTTVLRVDFSLPERHSALHEASGIIQQWWNEKAAPYEIKISGDTSDLSFSRGDFNIEFARTEQSLALAMEEPDSSVDGRSWIVELALKTEANRVGFGVRASYRQPYKSTIHPEPRAPRFLRQVIDEVGALDDWALTSSCQVIDESSVEFFMDFIESPSRTLPIIAISEDVQSGEPYIDCDRLARLLAGTSHIFRVDRNASWDISRKWGNEWSVFMGAVRCYNPRLDRSEDKLRHRLWLPPTISRLDASFRNGFLNALLNHVFTQDTAAFEPFPLLTPSVVRRQRDEAKGVVSLATPAEPPRTDDTELDIAPVAEYPIRLKPTSTEEPTGATKLLDLEEAYRELLKRSQRQDELALKLEQDLEQERAGRAETERKLLETEAELKMFTEENEILEQQKALAFGDVSKETSESLRPLWKQFSDFTDTLQNIAMRFRRLEIDSETLDTVRNELKDANQTILNQRATIESLNRRTAGSEDRPGTDVVSRNELLRILPNIVKKQISLTDILDVIALIFPDRLLMLDSAFESAEESASFQHADQAFDLLWRLATKYWAEIQTGGDSEARKIFGKAYASNEKSTLSKAGRERRTFVYKGQRILMDKHLKIGTADNSSDTLRIHFEWIAEQKRILIGHCGKHLDF